MYSKKNKNKCAYCYGHGIGKGFWDVGYRRVMDKGAHDKPMRPNEPCYQCDRCGEPKKYPPPPLRK